MTIFIYNGRHYYNDRSLGEWKYHVFEISMREYQKAYRSN